MRYLRATAVSIAAVLMGWLQAWPAAAAPAPCANLGGTVDPGQMCHVHASGATYTLDMNFPVDYPDQQALTDYITQNRDGFVNVAQTSGRRDQPYQMDATAEQHGAGQPPHNTRSVVLKFFQDLGERIRPIGTRRSTTTSAPTSRSRSTTCSRPASRPWTASSRSSSASWNMRPGWAPRYCLRPASTRPTTRILRSPTIS